MGGLKVRFDGLDVTAMVAHLQRHFLGHRVVNLYNGDTNESYIIKFDDKQFLLVESGIRFHPLDHFSSQSGGSMPSPFCAKLRKHLRSLRLEQIQQIGTDRVVLFQFGAGSSKHALILELYAKGNLILTDSEYKIISLLRSHVYDDGQVAVQVGQVYPVTYATSWKHNNNDNRDTILEMSFDEFQDWMQRQVADMTTTKKGKKKSSNLTLKTLLLKPSSGVSQYGPALIEHCILQANLKPHQSLQQDTALSSDDWETLKSSLRQEGQAVMDALTNATTAGYILYKPRDPSTKNQEGDLPHADKILEEFQPHLLHQHQDRLHLDYDNFGAAVEDFFAHITTQKRILKSQAAEAAAKEKLEKVKQDQQDRIAALEKEQEALKEQAHVVELHADNVDKALTVINSALDSGMDWDQLEQLVEVEQTNRNPVALLIQKLELDKDAMILRLPVDQYSDNAETVDVRVSLKESAFANASALFAKYRASKEKAEKTIEASTKALKAVEETTQRQLVEAQKRSKQTVAVAKRKPFWFEKFHWFITSNNYLVLGGKDAHQNELLVKRYLRPGDAYLHADVHGAASCVLRAKRRRLKNGKTEQVPLSNIALQEAGNFTICRSSAWSSRMVTSAWWVESHQVSKTAPSGEYLTVGSFMIRGKKNFLPPSQLEMGLAVLFRLGDDDSIARHKNERRDFALMELENAAEIGDNDDDDDDDYDGTLPTETAAKTDHPSGTESQAVKAAEDETSIEPETNGNPKDTKMLLEEASPDQDDNSGDDAEDEESENEAKEDTAKLRKQKRGLSVRDRKLIKKYGSLEEAERVQEAQKKSEDAACQQQQQQQQQQEEEAATSADVPETSNGQHKAKRGKRAKMKRAMKKYGDQDEEDRELAMLALQGGEKKKNKGKSKDKPGPANETQRKVAAETVAVLVKDSSKIAEQLPENVRPVLAECVTIKAADNESSTTVRWDKFDADILEQLLALEPKDAQMAAATRLLNLKNTTRVDNFSASLGGILRTIRKYGYEGLNEQREDSTEKPKRKTKAEKEKEESQWKKAMGDEGVFESDSDDDAVDDTVGLSKLTGKPHAEDLILHAVPVCAPYQTLSQYTYRVKLTPGGMKRGKAAKQCVDMLSKMDGGRSSASERCKELIKKVGDNEWVQVLCADVKISAPGASKATKKGNASSKKSKNKKKK